MFHLHQAMKGTPVRQIVRQPELEPGKILNIVQVKPDEETVANKISKLVDEVRLMLSTITFLACSSLFKAKN